VTTVGRYRNCFPHRVRPKNTNGFNAKFGCYQGSPRRRGRNTIRRTNSSTQKANERREGEKKTKGISNEGFHKFSFEPLVTNSGRNFSQLLSVVKWRPPPPPWPITNPVRSPYFEKIATDKANLLGEEQSLKKRKLTLSTE
jgi:hypothetical protein